MPQPKTLQSQIIDYNDFFISSKIHHWQTEIELTKK